MAWDLAIAWQYLQENPIIIVGAVALIWIIYLVIRRIKRKINQKKDQQQPLRVPTPPIIERAPVPPIAPVERFVRQTPNNPLGLSDFDVNVFNLEDNKTLIPTKDITGGLLERAENLRKELEANSEMITKQLSDIRSMKKEVADTALILKNYFQDLSKKELLLQTTLNSMGVRRQINNGGQQ